MSRAMPNSDLSLWQQTARPVRPWDQPDVLGFGGIDHDSFVARDVQRIPFS